MSDRGRWLAIQAGVLALALALVSVRFTASPPRGQDAPVDAFSAARAHRDLTAILDGIGPHPVGTTANDRVRERIEARLGELGYSPERQRDRVCAGARPCADVINIIALRDGGPAVVLLAAHYDSVPAGPGASDDGVGVAALLETARALGDGGDARNSVALLFTDGEEAGLLGAQAFMDHHPLAERVVAIVNVDSRGTSGPSLMFELAGPSSELVPLLDELPRPFSSSLFGAVYEALPNDTDLTRLRERGAVGFNFAFIGDVQNYHTARDVLENVSLASLQHQGENTLALARRLADEDLEGLRRGHRVVWFDWLGLGVLSWPERLSAALATLALALLFATAALARRREALRIVGRACLGAVGLVLASIVAGAVVLVLLWLTKTTVVPLHPVMWLPVSAVCAATLGLELLIARAEPGPFWLEFAGRWAALGIFGLALAVAFPAACYIFVPAVLVAGAAGVAGAHLRLEGARATALAAAATFCLATFWLQLAQGFLDAVDVIALPAIGAAAAFLVTTVPPRHARPPRRAAASLLGVAAVLAVAAVFYNGLT